MAAVDAFVGSMGGATTTAVFTQSNIVTVCSGGATRHHVHKEVNVASRSVVWQQCVPVCV